MASEKRNEFMKCLEACAVNELGRVGKCTGKAIIHTGEGGVRNRDIPPELKARFKAAWDESLANKKQVQRIHCHVQQGRLSSIQFIRP